MLVYNVKENTSLAIIKGKTKYGSYLTMILSAPSGVTRTAGANAYATKFATSPTITKSQTIQQQRFCKKSAKDQKSMAMLITYHN